jgi:hypothetical protein
MRREPATALARAASAAVVDGAGAIVAGIFGEVSALERACVDDEEVREGSRARQSRARVRRPILSISWRARVKRRCQSIAFPPRKKAGNAAATWRSDDRDFFPNCEAVSKMCESACTPTSDERHESGFESGSSRVFFFRACFY